MRSDFSDNCLGNVFNTGSVHCGRHMAASCSKCPCMPNGHHNMAWCNGDCFWKNNACHRRPGDISIQTGHFSQNICTEALEMVCTWLREISSCSCLTLPLGPAWVLLSKIYKPFLGSLYTTEHCNTLDYQGAKIDPEPIPVGVEG